ncbi:MAG TPA: hypothetical protein VFM69_04905 [Pricia sp.]|nr:hypothetical protein [Pricia sp.]
MDAQGKNKLIWIVFVIVALAILTGCFLLGRHQFPKCKPVDTARLDSIVNVKNLENDSLRAIISDMQGENDSLGASLDSINKAYSKQRERPITQEKELAEELVKKGNEDFGSPGNNSTTVTALSYGNQYADNYRIQKRQLANQKVKETAYVGVVRNQEVIIETQGEVIKQFYERKDKVRTKVGWFLVGLVTGLAIPL